MKFSLCGVSSSSSPAVKFNENNGTMAPFRSYFLRKGPASSRRHPAFHPAPILCSPRYLHDCRCRLLPQKSDKRQTSTQKVPFTRTKTSFFRKKFTDKEAPRIVISKTIRYLCGTGRVRYVVSSAEPIRFPSPAFI